MIETVRQYQYYEKGELESMNAAQIKGIYEGVIDWIEGIV